MPFDGSQYETTAKKMMEFFKGGRRWGRRNLYDHGRYCLLGAFVAVTKDVAGNSVHGFNATHLPAWQFLHEAANGDIPITNDNAKRYLKDIVPVLKRMHELEVAALLNGSAKPVSADPKKELLSSKA
jgi:hypothetical protein